MCFNTSKLARAKIAKEDIECWKALNEINGELRSMCTDYQYIKGKINPVIKIEKVHNYYFYEIREGYHSCRTVIEAESWGCGSVVHKFIIPKGTRYYSNRTEYVSETIILVG